MLERTSVLTQSLLAGLGGAVAGLLGTVVQQATFHVASGVDIPWGILVALALTAVYLVGIRLSFESRIPVLVGAICLVIVTGIGLMSGANDSVLVPANALGIVWSIGPGVVGLVVVAWPRFARGTKA